MNKILTKSIGILLVMIPLSFIIINCTNSYKYKKVLKERQEQTDTISIEDSVKTYIKQLNIDHGDIVYAQAVLESNNFKSKIFLENNNMFGMKEAMVRNTVALGTKNGFAYYKSPLHSVIDYALYQATYYHDGNRRVSRQVYLERLAKNYASDPNYIRKLIKIIDEQT